MAGSRRAIIFRLGATVRSTRVRNRDSDGLGRSAIYCLLLGTYEEEGDGAQFSRDLPATAGGAAVMTDRTHEIPQDLRNLVRVISACTLGLWAFAAGLLIGVFLFS